MFSQPEWELEKEKWGEREIEMECEKIKWKRLFVFVICAGCVGG